MLTCIVSSNVGGICDKFGYSRFGLETVIYWRVCCIYVNNLPNSSVYQVPKRREENKTNPLQRKSAKSTVNSWFRVKYHSVEATLANIGGSLKNMVGPVLAQCKHICWSDVSSPLRAMQRSSSLRSTTHACCCVLHQQH